MNRFLIMNLLFTFISCSEVITEEGTITKRDKTDYMPKNVIESMNKEPWNLLEQMKYFTFGLFLLMLLVFYKIYLFFRKVAIKITRHLNF